MKLYKYYALLAPASIANLWSDRKALFMYIAGHTRVAATSAFLNCVSTRHAGHLKLPSSYIDDQRAVLWCSGRGQKARRHGAPVRGRGRGTGQRGNRGPSSRKRAITAEVNRSSGQRHYQQDQQGLFDSGDEQAWSDKHDYCMYIDT